MRSASGAARSVTRARRAQRANAQTAPRGAGRPRGFRKVERTARGGVSKAILQLLHRPACDQNFSAVETSVRRGGGLRHLLDLPRRVDGGGGECPGPPGREGTPLPSKYQTNPPSRLFV